MATDLAAPVLDDPHRGEAIRSSSPTGRVATPDEVAGPVLFLCSTHASFVHGEILNVNGGACLAG